MTPEQRGFFETFGYIGMPGLLADDIDEIINAFEEIWAANGGGHAGKMHEGTARSCIAQFLDHHPRLCALLDDPRILSIATSLCDDNFNYMGSDGNYYVGDTGWHSDGWHPEIRHIKIAFYLDPLTKDTGGSASDSPAAIVLAKAIPRSCRLTCAIAGINGISPVRRFPPLL
ncbi:MAG: hypothetical protein QM758_11205 [Armatimonas sp.]